jgi:hypothetical protein
MCGTAMLMIARCLILVALMAGAGLTSTAFAHHDDAKGSAVVNEGAGGR